LTIHSFNKSSHLLGNRSYPENWEGWKCSKTKQEAGINLVNRDMIFVAAYCDKVRQNQESCGPEGKWYEEYKRPNLLVPETPYIYPKKPKGKITEDDLAQSMKIKDTLSNLLALRILMLESSAQWELNNERKIAIFI